MDWILAGLLVAVGLLAGALIVLVGDGRAWQNLIRGGEQQRQRLQSQLNQTERQLAHLHRQRHKLEQELAASNQALTAVQAEQIQTNQELTQAQSHIQNLEARLAGVLRQLTETQQLRQQLAAAEARIEEAEPIKSQLATRLAAAQHQLKFSSKQGKHELQVIRGIGPTYARKLADAGISQVTDLAEQTPEHLLSILSLKPGNLGKVEGWIAEAQELTNSLADEEVVEADSDAVIPPPQSNLS